MNAYWSNYVMFRPLITENAFWSHRKQVNLGSRNGSVLSGNKPFPEPRFTYN